MERYHPIVNFIFFAMVLGFGMFFIHPVCIVISLVGAIGYTILLLGIKEFGKLFRVVAVIMVLTAIINPAFSHQGVTVLRELPTGNMLTLESILYGIGAAGMLALVLLWFRCMGEIITSEKLVYLFGKSFPVLGLLLSMILGFIPKMQRKMREIRMARRVELVEGAGKITQMKHGLDNLSILVTWSLEDAADTADSMKSRGYGLLHRTTFTTYRFLKRDLRLVLILVVMFVYLIVGYGKGAMYWAYYPQVECAHWNLYVVSVHVVYGLLMWLPMGLTFREKWIHK